MVAILTTTLFVTTNCDENPKIKDIKITDVLKCYGKDVTYIKSIFRGFYINEKPNQISISDNRNTIYVDVEYSQSFFSLDITDSGVVSQTSVMFKRSSSANACVHKIEAIYGATTIIGNSYNWYLDDGSIITIFDKLIYRKIKD